MSIDPVQPPDADLGTEGVIPITRSVPSPVKECNRTSGSLIDSTVQDSFHTELPEGPSAKAFPSSDSKYFRCHFIDAIEALPGIV